VCLCVCVCVYVGLILKRFTVRGVLRAIIGSKRDILLIYLFIHSFILQEKKKELQLTFEEEERRIRMKSLGNIR